MTVRMQDWGGGGNNDARTTAREPSGSRVVAMAYLQDEAIGVTDFTSKSRACIS